MKPNEEVLPHQGTSPAEEIRVFLGSSSVFRQQLLSRAVETANKTLATSSSSSSSNSVFVVDKSERLVPDIDEKAIRHSDPIQLTKAITAAKTDRLLELLYQRPVRIFIYVDNRYVSNYQLGISLLCNYVTVIT